MKKTFSFLVLTIAFALATSSCAHNDIMKEYNIKQVPFVHSSMDFNSGKPHETTVQSESMDQLIKTLTALAEKRELVIVKKECTNGKCKIEYKRTDTQLAKTVGSGSVNTSYKGTGGGGTSTMKTYNMTFSSRIFADIIEKSGQFTIKFIGVPVINARLSCPDILVESKECEQEMFTVQGDDTPASSFKIKWGVDISGQLETEIIQGIFAEL